MSYTTFRFKAPILKGLADVQLSEPTPELKEVLKRCSTGQDLILASTQKDHAEKGPFIWTMNELSKTTLGYGTRMLVLCNDEPRVKRVVTFLRKLGEQIAFDAEAITADMEAQKVSNIIGKAPHAIVGTPSVLKEALEANRALLRDINLLYMMGAHKMEALEDVKAVFPRVISPKQRVVQLGKKATMALRHEVLTWVRDPHHVGIDPPIAGLETVVPPSPTEKEEPISSVNESMKEAVNEDVVASKDSTAPEASSDAPKPDTPKTETPKPADTATAPEAPKEVSSSPQDNAQLLETITPLLKRAMIPNDLPLATVVKRLKESTSQRAVVICQGPAEADALFKELREADLGVISVHSKLRRSTYDYRINRFQSGDVNIAIIGGRLKSQEPLKQVSRVLYTLLPRSKDTFLHDMSLVQWSDTPQEALFLIQEKDKESFETFKTESGLDCTPLVLDGLSDLKPVELLDRRKERRSNERSSSSSQSAKEGAGEQRSKGSKSNRTTKGGRGFSKSQGSQSQGERSQGNQSKGDSSQKGSQGSQNRGKGGPKSKQNQGKGRGKRAPEKPRTPYGLPRANFDQLDGGKEGTKPSGGLFGAIKKIFGS